MKPNIFAQSKKIIRDSTDKKKYLIQYRVLKIYVRHGKTGYKVHKIISFKQICGSRNILVYIHKRDF